VVSGEFVKKEHVATERSIYLNVFEDELEQLADAHNVNVWNAKTSALCRFCPVKQCEHNRG
jgi:hypothetical protein